MLIRFMRRARAFVVRDFSDMASYRLAFVMQFYGIFFSVALFYFIAKMFGQEASPALERHGGSAFPFILIGLGFMSFMTTGMGVFASSIRYGQITGTLEAMLVTPTSLTTIVLASSVWAYVRSALNLVLYLLVGGLFGLRLIDANWPLALAVVALSVTAFAGLGIISSAFVLAFKKGNPASALFGSVSSLLSGVYFPIELLPDWLQSLANLLPLTYALDGIRQALLSAEGTRPIATNLVALVVYTAIVLPTAVVAFRLAVRHAKREGSLAQY